jgi:hypothetical protein
MTDEPGGSAAVAAVRAHLEARLGPAQALPAAAPLPFDVYVVRPPDEDEPLVLFTLGASAAPMAVPPEVRLPARFELMMRVPRGWPLDEPDRTWGWPLAWLRAIAQLPARFGSWLGAGHTVPNGEPPRPLVAGSELCCFVLVPPVVLDEGDDVVATPEGPVALLSAMPIHASELAFLLERGLGELVARLTAAEVDDVIDPARPPVC